MNDKLRQELTSLLNRYSVENLSDTPDFILAVFMLNCLAAFNEAQRGRQKWYGQNQPSRYEPCTCPLCRAAVPHTAPIVAAGGIPCVDPSILEHPEIR